MNVLKLLLEELLKTRKGALQPVYITVKSQPEKLNNVR
jgi:hypothetical protein